MLLFSSCQCEGKAAGGNTKLAVDLEPNLCRSIIHRCLQSADGSQRKIRIVGIYNNVPVVIACPVYALPDPGDAQALRHHFQCAVGVGLQHEVLFQGISAQLCAGGNGECMLPFICCQSQGETAVGNAKLTVDLEPHLRGGIVQRCFQSADSGQLKVWDIRI